MLLISDVKLQPGFTDKDIQSKLRKAHIPKNAEWKMRKLSLDARKKPDVHFLCSLEVSWPGEQDYLTANRSPHIRETSPIRYICPEHGAAYLPSRPVIIGAGPAGLFAARLLAEEGYAPILIERGAPVDERHQDVAAYWSGGRLKPDSNVQFGEGGAGTFSDGKLNTQVKEKNGRIHQVLEWFVEAGASPEIRYWNKPHIGTDVLMTVVRNLREEICALGGTVRFHEKVIGLRAEGEPRRLAAILTEKENGEIQEIPACCAVLAIGHSARDTFEMLQQEHIPLRAKPFAVGVRIEHPQKMIQLAQYGTLSDQLPVADYKLTGKSRSGRGVYSFCMCPGGQVVNASSEEEQIAVNGMSRAARDGRNANSALVVTVGPEDFPGEGALAGVQLQRRMERLAWECGEGKVPVQLLGDFIRNQNSKELGEVEPDICGGYTLGSLRGALPAAVAEALTDCIPEFGRKIQGYDREDAVLSGVESRTSSPVRIERDERMESPDLAGLFPCGEGAGYAGGITSAAVDGMKVAEEIIRRYRSWI